MTALTEIRAALSAAPKEKPGRTRIVLLGDSAREAVYADFKQLRDMDDPRIDETEVRSTTEFRGWTIRDVDRAGVWHDVEPA